MTSKACAIALVTILIGGVAPLAAIAAEQAAIRLMSYNIRYDNPDDIPDWRARRGPMAAQIRKVQPDILGVQEALMPMVDDLTRALPGYDHYGVGRDDGTLKGESATVFYRSDRFTPVAARTFWCSPTPDVPAKAYDASLPRVFTRLVLQDRRNGTLLDVRNAHLDHVGVVSRERCTQQMRDLPAWPGAALITLGDFNSEPGEAPHRILTAPDAPYVDARIASPVVEGPAGTFNAFSPRPEAAKGQIDFIFVDRRLKVERFATLTEVTPAGVISDHFPVVADLVSNGLAPPATDAFERLRLDQLRIEGSHNSYRKVPSTAVAARIQAVTPAEWPGLAYGHPPLETQLALGLRQFELDVAPDPQGGLYARPYVDASARDRAAMAAPGAKVLHAPGLDTESHCLTLRACLAVFAQWSDAHPGHLPVVILINAADPDRLPGLFEHDVKFTPADIDALDRDIAGVIGQARIITPDKIRGAHATLREAVLAKAWPTLAQARGKFLFVLDGNGDHEAALRAGHASLRGRMMFGWFDEATPEAAVFNIQDPVADAARIRGLVQAGFIVRTRADAGMVEARHRDGGRMKAALASGAQWISTDYYVGAPDPENLGYTANFGGPPVACNAVTARCPGVAAP